MGLEEALPAGIALTSVEKVLGLARKYSQWPVTMGLVEIPLHIAKSPINKRQRIVNKLHKCRLSHLGDGPGRGHTVHPPGAGRA